MKKIILSVVVAAPLVLVAGFWVRNKVVGPVGWAQDDAEKALRLQLKDPDSMVIRSSFVVQKPGGDGVKDINVCCIVDAKNSFGGYTGGVRFVSHSWADNADTTFQTVSTNVEDPAESETAHRIGMLSGFEKAYWNDYCVDAKHPEIAPPQMPVEAQ